jgi:hypothetical protein
MSRSLSSRHEHAVSRGLRSGEARRARTAYVQVQVVALAAKGAATKEIARSLGISLSFATRLRREGTGEQRVRYQDRPLPSTYEEWLDRAREQRARFESKIRPIAGGCRLWQGAPDKDGYGHFSITGRGPTADDPRPVQKKVRAHRLAWEMENGPVPAGLVLRHSCDTPACCNTAHLKPGTQQENLDDCVRRGRSLRGTRNHKAVLDEGKVREIRSMAASGMSGPQIARALGTTRSVVHDVLSRKTWGHVA